MNVLLKSATIIDPKSDFHNETVDILIEQGVISKISKTIKNSNKIEEIQLENLHVSQGWFDSSVSFGEPGFEDRETVKNGLKTAALSGFTVVAINPNTNPVIDSHADVSFLKSLANNHATSLYPIGALTMGSKGEDLAEIFDMHNSGAKAFGDYKKPISNPNLLKIALQYASGFNGLVCSFPFETKVAGKGVMNENVTSTTLGLKGIPSLAEELYIARDLYLLQYAGGKLHIPTISTAKSVELIREAKKMKLDVTCSVAIHNLILEDKELVTFDTRYKVLPPLRLQEDNLALLEGLKDGTIDMVTSDHHPLDVENKKVEFDHAEYGTIGLESAFGALNNLVTTKKAVEFLTRGKERFGIDNYSIKEGQQANMTLFNPTGKWIFETKHIISTSKNSIFMNKDMKGRTYGIYANNLLQLKS